MIDDSAPEFPGASEDQMADQMADKIKMSEANEKLESPGYDVARGDMCPGCGRTGSMDGVHYWCSNPFCDVRAFRSRTTNATAPSHNVPDKGPHTMSSTKRYEIQAIAFNIMTGHVAPGKDASVAAGDDYAEREEAWKRWKAEHGRCVRAMLQAFDHLEN